MTLHARAPRHRYRVQSTTQEREGKLRTAFSLSKGMLGLRGVHVSGGDTQSCGVPLKIGAGAWQTIMPGQNTTKEVTP